MTPLAGVAALCLSYLVGSTPHAWLAGKVLKGVDLRQHGSGNLGATNVYRTLGAPAALVVFLLDMAKGLLPTLIVPQAFGLTASWWPGAIGVATILGHVRPYVGLFRGGGKGVATAAGVFAALTPAAFFPALSVFLVTTVISRIVSLGSILGSLALGITAMVIHGPASGLAWLCVGVASFVVYTHRANIRRLMRGEEPRLSRPGGTG